MPADRHIGRGDRNGDALLRAVSRATSAATVVLDPELIPHGAAEALVRYLGVLRADVWRFDGRRPVHLASVGPGHDDTMAMPAIAMRLARGGLAGNVPVDELGGGAGTQWRRLLFALGCDHLGVYSLSVGERCLGAITVIDDGECGELQQEALAIFAQQVAAAMEKAELHQAAQDSAMTMRLQNRVLVELTDERDIPSLRTALEEFLGDLLGEVAASLLPVDSLGRVTVPSLVAPSEGTLRIATSPELEAVGMALDADRPIRMTAPPLRTCAALGLGLLAAIDLTPETPTTLWGVQLRTGERITGILLVAVADTDERKLARIPELLHAIGPAASISLENAQLFAREHVRASRLATANTLARTVTGCATVKDLHEALVIGVRALFGFTRSATYDTEVTPIADEGAGTRGGARERTLASTTLHRRRASRVERHDRTCHAIPLISGERIHAVLYVEQLDTVTPEQENDDLALLASVCEHAAACLVAIEASERIERNYKDTIQALVHALEARDQYTADHSDAVAGWALEVGRRLGMNEDDLRDLELGAILHDIGKVAIPDSILNKNGRLTAEEFEVMKSHTVVGERILQPIGFLERVAPIVRHEHERWDGRGYPDGISGTDIPLASRIIFVCDAYHAITSDRPYREGQSHAFARKVITENAGTQFDPAVVGVFLEVVNRWYLDEGMLHEVEIATTEATGIEIVNPLGRVQPAASGEERSREATGEGSAAA